MVLVLSLVVYVSIGILATPASQLLLLLYLFAMITRLLSRSKPTITILRSTHSIIYRHRDGSRCKAAAEPEPKRSEGIELQELSGSKGFRSPTRIVASLSLSPSSI